MTHSDRGLKPQAVLFDWDNTLVDSWPIIHDALNTTFRAFGLRPWTLSETRQKVRHSMRDNFPKLFGDRWEVAGEVFYKHYGAIHAKKLEPTNGAEEMLHGLSVAGIYLGIVSNKKGDFLRTEAAHLGWDRYFGGIVGANDAKNDKPAADPVGLALAGSGIPLGRDVWLAGDADIDMECAENAGCVPVLIRENGPGTGEFTAHPPARHFDGCLALSKCVRKL